MVTRSTGLLLHRSRATDGGSRPEVVLGHPGGPLFARRDDGAWTIPKGEYGPDEEPLAAAYREFTEEIGIPPPAGPARSLGETLQGGRKVVTVWAVAGDLDVARISSNTFTMPWPPRSGRLQSFPELDRAAWFDLDTARRKVFASQLPFLDRLAALLGAA